MTYQTSTMPTENEVFRKIKEMSARGMQPRPTVYTSDLASELSISADNLLRTLAELKQLRLISFGDNTTSTIKLTLLGTVVNRDK